MTAGRKDEPTIPGAEGADGPHIIYQGEHTYPNRLIPRLGAKAPKLITVVASLAPLSSPQVALLCLRETAGATILKAFDQAAALRDAGKWVVSGFHFRLERQCLDILLREKQPIVVALARGISELRLSYRKE